jgi:hypothetical protein
LLTAMCNVDIDCYFIAFFFYQDGFYLYITVYVRLSVCGLVKKIVYPIACSDNIYYL